MTCGCRRAVAHLARCMTANGRSGWSAVKPHPRGVDQTTGLPWGFIGEFSPSGAVGLGRWLFNDIAASSQHVSRWRLPRVRGQAAVAAMAAAGSSPRKGLSRALFRALFRALSRAVKGSDARMTSVVRRCGPCQ